MVYSLSKFRENMREAFNKAEQGEKVVIQRYGVTYLLWREGVIPHEKLSTDEVSSRIRPDLPNEQWEESIFERGNENIKENRDGTISPIQPRKPSKLFTKAAPKLCKHGYVKGACLDKKKDRSCEL